MSKERRVPRLSIVIPWFGASAAFEDTLVSVLQHRPAQSEILVVHNVPYDDPFDIADEGVQLIECQGFSEIALVNAGFQYARSPLVHVLGCGLEVTSGWTEPAIACFNHPRVACVSPVIQDRHESQRIVATGVAFRGGSRQACGSGYNVDKLSAAVSKVIGPTLAAGFYRRDDVRAVNGFEEVLGPAADVDLSLTLQHFGFECPVALECRIWGSDSPAPVGGFQTGQQHERLFWRQASLGRISTAQHVLHAWTILARSASQFPSPRMISELTGRLAGLLERKHYAEFRERMQHVETRDVNVRPESAQQRRLAA